MNSIPMIIDIRNQNRNSYLLFVFDLLCFFNSYSFLNYEEETWKIFKKNVPNSNLFNQWMEAMSLCMFLYFFNKISQVGFFLEKLVKLSMRINL